MATASPSPNSVPVSPAFSPPPIPSSSISPTSAPPGPPPQTNNTLAAATPAAQLPASTPPPRISPSQSANQPPPSTSPPPPMSSPLPSSQPPPSSVPPPISSPPPPSIPPTGSQPPPLATPPIHSPPPPPAATPPIPSRPPPTNPPTISPPPPSINPPTSSSPPPTVQQRNAPPPPPTDPPEISPPPPSSQPPRTSPPPPSSGPHESSPPPPASTTPKISPPPPGLNSPERSPLPPVSTPPTDSAPPPVFPPSSRSPPTLPPSSKFPPGAIPPLPVNHLSPPPPLVKSPLSVSPPSPSLVPFGDPLTNTSGNNASDNTRSTGGGGIGIGGTIAISLLFGLLFLGIIGTAARCMCKRKKKASGPNGGYILPTSSPKSDSGLLKMEMSIRYPSSSGSDIIYSPPEPGGLGNSRSWFTYEELLEATGGFSAQNLLGEGGFGSVYKGCLADGREVAVKQLKIGGGQGEREFRAEVEIISRIHHRHLVSLVGYCISDHQRLLVYDYVPNKTLHFHLHGEGRPVMDWATRVKIAVGASRGIAYLHEDCHPRIIHRDIKSSNILLDNSFEARVSDFGLAKLFQDTNTHVTTRVIGTFGYMAPEYASSGKLTEKSDVFSFGVVLLELITGRKPVDASQPLGAESLVEWARPLLSHALETEEFEGLVDPRLDRNFVVESEMLRLIEIAAACVRHSSSKRPQMGQVVRAFDSMATADITNGMRVGESQIINSAQQSEEIRFFRRMAFGNEDYSTDFFRQSGDY